VDAFVGRHSGVASASQAVADFPAHSLEQLLDAHPDGDLVRSMPGMGTTLSAEFLAEVVSIQQFPTGNALAAASGLARHRINVLHAILRTHQRPLAAATPARGRRS
jgi:transposase